MSVGKKLSVGLVAIVGLLVIPLTGFWIYFILNSGDIEKPDDSALMPSSVIVSKEENAFYDIQLAADSLVLAKDDGPAVTDMTSGKNWNDALANRIVNDNADALAAFDRASWKKMHQDPALQVNLKTLNADTELASISKVRQVAQVSAIRSRILFRQGKEKEAFDNAMNILYLGQALENSPRTNLIGFLIGMAIKGVGIANIQEMAQSSHLTSGELKAYAIKMEKFKGNTMGLQEAFRMEYVMLNNTKEQMIDPSLLQGSEQSAQALEQLAGDSIDASLLRLKFYYKPNESQQLIADIFQEYVNNAAKPCSGDEIRKRPSLAASTAMGNILNENAIGKILADVSGSSFNGAFSKRCQEEFSVIKAQIALASAAYKADKGAYPTSFVQLAPAYVPTVSDTYDGKPIVYDVETGTVTLAQ